MSSTRPDIPTDSTERPPWYLHRYFFRAVVLAFVVGAVVEGVIGIGIRKNDFAVHREFGQRFLNNDPYYGGGPPYPMGRLAMNATLALMPHRVARAVVFPLSIAALFATFGIWHRLAHRRWPGRTSLAFPAAAFTFTLLGPYIVRDFDDCGLHLILLFFLSMGVWTLFKRRQIQSGFWLALAVTYKLTPVLFLPLLIWKRQWKASASLIVFFVGLNLLLPAVFLGWNSTLEHNQTWGEKMARCVTARDPSAAPFEWPRVQNQCLPVAITRYLQTFPPGHRLYLDHPLYRQFGNFSRADAVKIMMVIMLTLAGVLAYCMRQSWNTPAGKTRMPQEWASTCILVALVTQLCWLQHLVALLPAVYLTVYYLLTCHMENRRPASRQLLETSDARLPSLWTWPNILRFTGLGAIGVITLLMGRGTVGRELSLVVLSYKFDTLAGLIALTLAMTLPMGMHFSKLDVQQLRNARRWRPLFSKIPGPKT